MVGPRRRPRRRPRLRRAQRPRHRRAARRDARSRGAPAGAGRLDGGLRRGPLRLRRARRRPAGPARRRRPRRRALRAALPALRPRPRRPAWCAEDAPARPAQHLRRHQARPGAPGRRVGAADRRERSWSLRYHNVYGPRMPRDTPYSGVASIFRSALERGEAPRVLEDGGSGATSCTSATSPRPTCCALRRPSPDPALTAVNVCSGEPHTVGELAAALAAAMRGPEPVVVGGGRAGDVRHVVADPARARALLGLHRPRSGSPRGCGRSPPIRCAPPPPPGP